MQDPSDVVASVWESPWPVNVGAPVLSGTTSQKIDTHRARMDSRPEEAPMRRFVVPAFAIILAACQNSSDAGNADLSLVIAERLVLAVLVLAVLVLAVLVLDGRPDGRHSGGVFGRRVAWLPAPF